MSASPPSSLRDPSPSGIYDIAVYCGGALCLALITLVYPGATRMWAWPWTLALTGVLVLPTVWLVTRTLLARTALPLPATGWLGGALGAIGLLLLSALISPYRASSLLWAAPWLGGIVYFFVGYAWLHRGGDGAAARAHLDVVLLLAFGMMGVASLGGWLAQLREIPPAALLGNRNPFSLGHSSYTAATALLALPVAAVAAWRRRGAGRRLGVAVAGLALAMLFTSGSRGGMLAVPVLAIAAFIAAPLRPKPKAMLAVAGLLAGLAFAVANPRTRTMFTRAQDDSPVAASNVQRDAMLTAAWRMGRDRPLLGWGPGTTPLVYPLYRGGLEGGTENVFQLHSLPAHLWAELGSAGVLALLGFCALAVAGVRRDPVAAVTLLGYGVFAITDWQLDVPIFAALIGVFAARLAGPGAQTEANRGVHGDAADGSDRRPHLRQRILGSAVLLAFALVALLGRRDPLPEQNARALMLARDPSKADQAIALLRESLAANPDQEIAHFNLGWLLVVRDPAAAERHFRAGVRLVPDKGGIYFGLALALLNQGRSADAAQALALECLNDPAFLVSPWWREPAIAGLRDPAEAGFKELVERTRALAPKSAPRLDKLVLLARETGRVPDGPERAYHRERTGYPVLMRNLNFGPPTDLYVVRELKTLPAWVESLPAKGWLPSPVLLALLADRVPPKP